MPKMDDDNVFGRIKYGGVLWLVLGLLSGGPGSVLLARQQAAHASPCDRTVICPAETLVYEVSWMKIRLGQVRLVAGVPTTEGGTTAYHAAAYIDSYQGLPFVDIHAVDHSTFDSGYYSRGFYSSDKKDNYWKTEHSLYDFSRRLIFIENITQRTRKSPPDGPPVIDTIRITDTLMEDGLSILYFARAYLHTAGPRAVPTLVYRKLGATRFAFPGAIEPVEIDLFPGKKIRSLRFTGKAEFEGIFGLTGDFEGWFSDDNAAVPLSAEIKVLIGSVRLELVRCSRPGWEPPEILR